MISVVLLVISSVSYAEIPEDYYNTAVGKSGAKLKTALFNIIHPHTMLEYYSSSTSFRTTDWHPATSEMPNGYFWDMYSNFKRTSWSDMNREHCLPKSWFGISSDEVNSAPIATDLHNLYPSDATANSRKNNYPLGIVLDDPKSNGVIKVGPNTYPGYTGTVFEPADEYKGDFARDYMYMVTCYEDYANTWQSLGTSSMLIKGSTYPVFKQYSINLLMEWSRNDPVSKKEINRNEAVYELQGNRNPFIDYPVLSEYVWGEYTDETWSGDNATPEEEPDFYVHYDFSSKILFAKILYPESSVYKIYNLSGIIISEGSFSSDATINLSDLSKGMYIIVIYSNKHRKTAKILI